MKNWREVLNDLYAAMMNAVGSILWGSPVHSGFYQTMFFKFPAINKVPLGKSELSPDLKAVFVSHKDVDFIKGMIDTFLQQYDVPDGITINLHVTVRSSDVLSRNHKSDFGL